MRRARSSFLTFFASAPLCCCFIPSVCSCKCLFSCERFTFLNLECMKISRSHSLPIQSHSGAPEDGCLVFYQSCHLLIASKSRWRISAELSCCVFAQSQDSPSFPHDVFRYIRFYDFFSLTVFSPYSFAGEMCWNCDSVKM